MMADRITSLPDTILLHILSFLTTKEAVRTSVLAKRWTPLWRSVSTLVFNHTSSHIFVETSEESVCRFVQSVYIAINSRDLHQPIQKFRLHCWCKFCDTINFNVWINSVVQRRVEHLDLSFSLSPSIVIPNCKTLVILKLEHLSLKGSTPCDLPLLQVLHLEDVKFSDPGHLADLLSGSPLLEDLKATDLSFSSRSNVRPFKSLSKLVKACVDKFDVPLIALENVKFLQMKLVNYEEPIPLFSNVTHIELTLQVGIFIYSTEFVMEVIKHSPRLQFLSINTRTSQRIAYEREWAYPEIVPDCISSCLRTCRLTGYKGSTAELKFACYIMENAAHLQTMTINSPSLESANYRMLKMLSMCTRLSSSCKLHFLDDL